MRYDKTQQKPTPFSQGDYYVAEWCTYSEIQRNRTILLKVHCENRTCSPCTVKRTGSIKQSEFLCDFLFPASWGCCLFLHLCIHVWRVVWPRLAETMRCGLHSRSSTNGWIILNIYPRSGWGTSPSVFSLCTTNSLSILRADYYDIHKPHYITWGQNEWSNATMVSIGNLVWYHSAWSVRRKLVLGHRVYAPWLVYRL